MLHPRTPPNWDTQILVILRYTLKLSRILIESPGNLIPDTLLAKSSGNCQGLVLRESRQWKDMCVWHINDRYVAQINDICVSQINYILVSHINEIYISLINDMHVSQTNDIDVNQWHRCLTNQGCQGLVSKKSRQTRNNWLDSLKTRESKQTQRQKIQRQCPQDKFLTFPSKQVLDDSQFFKTSPLEEQMIDSIPTTIFWWSRRKSRPVPDDSQFPQNTSRTIRNSLKTSILERH